MNKISAIAVINPHLISSNKTTSNKTTSNIINNKCYGTIIFNEINKNKVEIKINLKNIKEGLHGFHIHETGNLSKGCSSCCAHFNPTNTTHGDITDKIRHIGDLGNIKANKKGEVNMTLVDDRIKLRGTKYNIIGRSVVIHEKEDDLGRGGNAESLKTGNAGARIGCAVIGYKDPCYF